MKKGRNKQQFVLEENRDSFGIVEAFLTNYCRPCLIFDIYFPYFPFNMKKLLFPGKIEVLTINRQVTRKRN